MRASEPQSYNQFIIKNFGQDLIIKDYAGDYVVNINFPYRGQR